MRFFMNVQMKYYICSRTVKWKSESVIIVTVLIWCTRLRVLEGWQFGFFYLLAAINMGLQ